MSVEELAHTWGIRGGAGAFTAPIPAAWTFGGRCFGGYAAAAAIVAGLVEAGVAAGFEDCRLISAHVAFTRGIPIGAVSIRVEVFPAGRRVKWLRCLLLDGDEVLTLVTCCVRSFQAQPRTSLPPSAERIEPFAPTQPRIAFLADLFPFQADFDERAVDYPPSREHFGDGARTISVLTQATLTPFAGPGLTEQLWDLAAADLHLLDAACRYNHVPLENIVSVDLTINWSGQSPAADGWRLIEAESTLDSMFPVATGRVVGSAGDVRAYALSVGRLLTEPVVLTPGAV
jgi:hypothetical protein